MPKTLMDALSPFLFLGIVIALVGTAAYFARSIFSPGPADVSGQDPKVLKDWIRTNDLPIGGGRIKLDELPAAYARVIDHDVQSGDLKSARQFIAEAMQRKLDTPVLALCQRPEAKELVATVQNAHRKVEVLKQFLAALQRGDGTADLNRQADEFCRIPFDASACPEQAEEIAGLYQGQLLSQKDKDGVEIKKVIGAVEGKCLPRPQPAGKGIS